MAGSSHTPYGDFEPVIGLEIHVELNTRSKLFSSALNHFGDEPNTNISEVCTGQPGALPVLNKEAIDKALLFGLAISATLPPFSKFDRKSYFYPDSPRNFQITQYDKPIVVGGKVTIEIDNEEKEILINRAHLEDDAGMLKHYAKFTGIDYNRAGVPLIEIVTEPCIHSPKEAALFAQEVRSILLYLDISDCNMEEGSLRIDANVSIRKQGETHLATKCEIKNMNSFNFLELALDQEILRQIQEYAAKRPIRQATYRFNGEKGTLSLMRYKERAEDYRYFPEPDLPPIFVSKEKVEELRQKLPELPQARRKRYQTLYRFSEQLTLFLVQDKKLSDYFEEGLKSTSHFQELANWIVVEFVGKCKERGLELHKSIVKPAAIAELVNLIKKGTITGKIAKEVAEFMMESGDMPSKILQDRPDLLPMNDAEEVEKLVDKALLENPQSVIDIKAGKTKALAYLIGQVMKWTKGKANPELVNELFSKKIQ